MKSINKIKGRVTVVGLGQMGTTFASLLLKNDYDVTVWNRTESKAQALVREGATMADDIVSAVNASPIIVVCVYDYHASKEIFNGSDVAGALKGKTLIQFTTGSPNDASESEAWAKKWGAHYLDGAIQVAPDQMGRPDTTMFVSGAQPAYHTCEDVLKVFGGNVKYLGEKIGAASAMDVASLSYMYGSILGFFHAVNICEAEGFPLDLLGKILREVSPGFAEFLHYETEVIQSGKFNVTQSPLSISVEATERILQLSQAYRINTEVPKLAADFFKRAKAAGYEKEELASLIKVFRSRAR